MEFHGLPLAKAVDALVEIGGKSAVHILQYALADENGSIRETATEYIAELANRER